MQVYITIMQDSSHTASSNLNSTIDPPPLSRQISQYTQTSNEKINSIGEASTTSHEFSKPQRKLLKSEIQRMLELKQQLLAIRERKAVIPKVPDPEIVDYFADLKLTKQAEHRKRKLVEKINEKKKELQKFKQLYQKSFQQYEQKSEIFREKSALQRVLAGKMEAQLNKTKQRFRQVQFNKVIVEGVRKVLYYRLAEILFNFSTRNIFSIIQNIRMSQQKLDEDSTGNCLGYLGLFMMITATICGAKTWISFAFRGPKSTIKAADGSILVLHPKESRLNQAQKLLNQQLYQIMHDSMGLKIQNYNNFYQLCEQLSKKILKNR